MKRMGEEVPAYKRRVPLVVGFPHWDAAPYYAIPKKSKAKPPWREEHHGGFAIGRLEHIPFADCL